MEKDIQRSISLRISRRGDKSNPTSHSKDGEGGLFSSAKFSNDYPMKIMWKRGFIRLVLVAGCPIPVANNPNEIVIPEGGTPDKIVKNLSYFMEDELVNNGSQPSPLFGGHQSWSQRKESFKLNSSMKVHCGFMHGGGAEMDPMDIKYVNKCRLVVASGIFDGYDVPHQPSNISDRSKKLFCFLMVVDEVSLDFIKENATVVEDRRGDYGSAYGVLFY
ncbi:hypothetical protein GH714_025032 [Hevea brasiliensis]|uniref:TOD1/MUCI70 glycosyltransferase-like domain-containing protein n=1 Tax=Hevea brasiliensis TaxID=3981 RepID=A0A6A6LB81_HEVBR|nr:hypothetical protein GH714_025032 [Hevea brasiliensis]